jgi:hypothetical protein
MRQPYNGWAVGLSYHGSRKSFNSALQMLIFTASELQIRKNLVEAVIVIVTSHRPEIKRYCSLNLNSYLMLIIIKKSRIGEPIRMKTQEKLVR